MRDNFDVDGRMLHVRKINWTTVGVVALVVAFWIAVAVALVR